MGLTCLCLDRGLVELVELCVFDDVLAGGGGHDDGGGGGWGEGRGREMWEGGNGPSF
jgi:hypothetical protein